VAEASVLTARELVLPSGDAGQPLSIDSANPRNYHQAINAPAEMPRVTIDGRLFVPKNASKRLPVVIVVPGSLGVAPSHLRHAQTFVELGIAACVIDPFGRRGVTSTVSNQAQYSFAASAYDVLASVRVLSREPAIDAKRIGAQGHSRGGSAVLTAATRRFADAVVGAGRGMQAVLAAYPWSGQQFLDPRVGDTEVRVLMGDRDEWCSPQQVQGHVQAIRLTGGKATMRLFAGAAHSFDRGTAIQRIAEASVSPGAPTSYIADDGAFIHPLEEKPRPELVDRDLMVYGLKAGYGSKGASIGSKGEDAALFRADMLDFWRRALLG